MKVIIPGVLTLLFLNLNAQNMTDPEKTVTGLFIATDQRDWQTVQQSFSDEVVLDYSSMNGHPASKLTPAQIIDAWKGVLPGFEHTHHQLGNFRTQVDGNKAAVFCYGTASHYLSDPTGNLWIVVGTYDFELEQQQGAWKITSMTFHYKYQDGNTSLPAKAMHHPNKNKASVRAFFEALESENVEQLVALFAENARQINPYASGLFPEGANGKDAIRDYWTPVFPNFDGMQFPIEEIYLMEDPNIVFVKYKGVIKLKNGAGLYENDYYSTFKFDEKGLITEYVEIFNPIVAARGFGLTDKIK
ncbi:MAG: nuclear transport factor 2 family protein [Bacteroidota bacterium]